MKLIKLWLLLQVEQTLYPTWFRWNSKKSPLPCFLYWLYIPHGSDETIFKGIGKLIENVFISHMVQMKLQSISFNRKLILTLYPTWFRWNLEFYYGGRRQNTLYIPHGSDETNAIWQVVGQIICFISHMVQMKHWSIGGKDENSLSLYPTWFRWNCAMTNYPVHFKSLYIPHGSDETYYLWCSCTRKNNFISHMVQMKRRKKWKSVHLK